MNIITAYIKIDQKIAIVNKKILLGDIGKIYCQEKDLLKEIKNIEIMIFEDNKDCKIVVSILKIIELINKKFPLIKIVNLGETSFIIEYFDEKNPNKILEYCKIIFVIACIFFGSAFTIMTFNTDVSVEDVFDLVYELVMGDVKSGPSLLEISYSIGLPIGILVFFNHVGKIKIHKDPTPITTQMRLYEKDVNVTCIEDASREGKVIDVD